MKQFRVSYVLGAFAALTLLPALSSAEEGRKFQMHERVPVIVNKVGPFNNPSETYQYYSLPYCKEGSGGVSRRERHGLGELLVGDRKVVSPYEVNFLDSFTWRLLCKVELSEEDKKTFAEAIEDEYYFEMFVDGLPMYGYVGEPEGQAPILGHTFEGSHTFLYPHLHFSIGYNKDQIVSVNVTTLNQRKVEILDPNLKEVEFSYSVDWIEEPQLAWADRMLRYADSRFIPSTFEIHWLSIINSFVLVLLLTIFLTIILMRVLKNDVSRYMEIDNDEILEEESGWKLIHGDVFRFPSHINLLAALIGSGVQLCATTALLLICALSGVFRATKRGSILTALLLIYVLTSFITGYISARLYRQMGGKNWTWNIITAALVFPGPLALVWSFLNSVAWSNASTAALPAATVFIILGLFIFVSFPLSVVGGIAGRNSAGDFDAPCRTKKVAREIPKDGPCFQHPVVQALLAGFLPFSAIYIELHYIFNSIWGHKIYTLFGILVLAFIMLFMVTSLITIALIYFQLTREDHRWWWRTFLNGGATGLFILAYSFFYYFQRSEMDGFFQASYFFGYMAIVSYAFFIMLGSVGFLSSLSFVRHIYSVIKTD
ncbi:hypothetical protein NSK_002478 [Nannochloropsis salina CCMP1776]|uniref:Transmembrane 9 superfamily member n=1 Tax=Nannochloropsis salina CCMP1776 TaxID=1027361 RepID=A0A4D9D4A1_9STRA|nr:hypothetical protein NSK_002478 [Nannochloropsis salina CCMP1776]|eukprot:TFJ86270.1 hypothetical protein NSK_002478 [Nannochloropsis salina CCMP1776]